MIAADAKLLTYPEAAERLGCKAETREGKCIFIARRVADDGLTCTRLGHNSPRITELNLLKYIERKSTTSKPKKLINKNKS